MSAEGGAGARVQWTEHYGIYSAALADGALVLTVAWNSTEPKNAPRGYRVRVGNRRLTKLFDNAEAGKAAAIRFAAKIIVSMEADLDVLKGPLAAGAASPPDELRREFAEALALFQGAAGGRPVQSSHVSRVRLADVLERALRGVSRGAAEPLCDHRFDHMVCVALAGHDGPHITSNERFPHGRQLPAEPPDGSWSFTAEGKSPPANNEWRYQRFDDGRRQFAAWLTEAEATAVRDALNRAALGAPQADAREERET